MIGVLALQGGFREHRQTLDRLGVASCEIRQRSDLAGRPIDGLILPGGESTVIGRLLHQSGLFEPIRQLIRRGLPVFGTCAGLILLASRIVNDDSVYLAAIEIAARRNAFGRQLGSFRTEAEFAGIGPVPMTFIRAPVIEQAADSVRILARVDGKAVAAECGNVLVTAFHPELTDDCRIHAYFLAHSGAAGKGL